jgi:hypothetical protein
MMKNNSPCETFKEYFENIKKMRRSFTTINTHYTTFSDLENHVFTLFEELENDHLNIYVVDYVNDTNFKQWRVTVYSLAGIITYHIDCIIDADCDFSSDNTYILSFQTLEHPIVKYNMNKGFDLYDYFLKKILPEDDYHDIVSWDNLEKPKPLKSLKKVREHTVEITLKEISFCKIDDKINCFYENQISSISSICKIILERGALLEDEDLFLSLREVIYEYISRDDILEDVKNLAKCAWENLPRKRVTFLSLLKIIRNNHKSLCEVYGYQKEDPRNLYRSVFDLFLLDRNAHIRRLFDFFNKETEQSQLVINFSQGIKQDEKLDIKNVKIYLSSSDEVKKYFLSLVDSIINCEPSEDLFLHMLEKELYKSFDLQNTIHNNKSAEIIINVALNIKEL